jgi:hypothetical protein
MECRGRSGPIDDTRSRNVENAGAIGGRRDDLHVVPTLRQPDGGLGYRDGWAAVSRREPRDDVEDPHRGPSVGAVPGLAADPESNMRRGRSTMCGLGSRSLKAAAVMRTAFDNRCRISSRSAEA